MSNKETNGESFVAEKLEDRYSDLPSKAEYLSQCAPGEKLIAMAPVHWLYCRKLSLITCNCPHGLDYCEHRPDYPANNFEVYSCPDFIDIVLTREKNKAYEANYFDASVHCKGNISVEWLCTFEDYKKFAQEKGLYQFEDYTVQDTSMDLKEDKE